MVFGTSFDDEQAVRAISISRLIPLQFLVPHKTVFVVPVGRVGCPVPVEFVVPDQFPIVRTARGKNRQQQQGQGKGSFNFHLMAI